MTSEAGPGDALAPRKVTPHHGAVANKLNSLRAAVLGANDGIVSTAGIVVGVAAATAERGPVFTAGIAGLAAGALSMAVGEYVSVSTQGGGGTHRARRARRACRSGVAHQSEGTDQSMAGCGFLGDCVHRRRGS